MRIVILDPVENVYAVFSALPAVGRDAGRSVEDFNCGVSEVVGAEVPEAADPGVVSRAVVVYHH